ncbi:MAG: Gfo/Idh/MocA family oxidoreductase [Planctomycetes bacterium]|nr:Gfo/Idh/MocA family oxidoreductase [Planctomycetota bacterium]
MTKRTRRQFLKDSMLAAAAVTAPMISGSAEARSSSANERLRCAVVGCKGRGGSHIIAFSDREDCEIAYIVDIDEKVGQDRCNSIEKSTGRRPRFVRDMREAFDDKSVNIVSTATPNHWHALCGVWAMQAGKDLYI